MSVERSEKASKTPPAPKRRLDAEAGSNPQVSNALRSAYDEAVKEDIPAEFLDLLRKLS